MEAGSDILTGLGAAFPASGAASANPAPAANPLFNQLFLALCQGLPEIPDNATTLTTSPPPQSAQALTPEQGGKGLPLARQGLVLFPGGHAPAEQALTGLQNAGPLTPTEGGLEELPGEIVLRQRPESAPTQLQAQIQSQAQMHGQMQPVEPPKRSAEALALTASALSTAHAEQSSAAPGQAAVLVRPGMENGSALEAASQQRAAQTAQSAQALESVDSDEITVEPRGDKIVDARIRSSSELDLLQRNQLLGGESRAESVKPMVEALTGARSIDMAPPQNLTTQTQPAAPQGTGVPRELHTAIPLNAQTDPGFANALGEKISWLVGKGNQTATIQLAPEELGHVQVRVTMGQNGTTQIEIHARNSATGDLMESMLPKLQSALESQGIKLDDVRFSQSPLSSDSGGLAQRGEAGTGRGQAGQAGTASDHNAEEVVDDTALAFETPLTTASGVDYYA